MEDSVVYFFHASTWFWDLWSFAAWKMSHFFWWSSSSFTWSYNVLISSVCRDIFWTALANWSATSLVLVVADIVVGRTVIGSGSKGAVYLVAFSFSLINFSIFVSICFNWVVCSMMSFIMSAFSVSVSTISLARGSLVAGRFNYFLSVVISKFFFLIISSTT